MVKHGEIIRLKKGLYVLDQRVSRAIISPFLLANHIYGPSYVSMHSALRYYGLIPEMVYSVQSMTTGVARDYENSIGRFSYIHVSAQYYQPGVTIAEEESGSFMIASPEKALCDLMVYTPNLNFRYQTEIQNYLEEDIRFDMEALSDFDLDIIADCAKVSKKKEMLNQLIRYIHERNI
jgi:predicted transcriptional regulator of viral defense system